MLDLFNFLMLWDSVVWALKRIRMNLSEKIGRYNDENNGDKGKVKDVKSGGRISRQDI